MVEAIKLIRKYYNVGDTVAIDDIAIMYHELTWRDLYEDNDEETLSKGLVVLTLFGNVEVIIALTPISEDSYTIRSIKAY